MPWAMEMYRERFNKDLNTQVPKELKNFKLFVDDPTSSYAVSGGVAFHAMSEAIGSIKVIMQQYSACCAFEQLNYFSYSCKGEKVPVFLDHVIKMMRRLYKPSYAQKLVINTVQQNPEKYSTESLPSDLDLKKMNGAHYYPAMFKWATNQKKFIDTPVVNHNTGNIIHHIITFVE